ncbi:MAG TPA: PstS family phosphate ABC transporter substrate-binding protein [Trueperaceae bacterium]|jgi:phosphate transport system substrate-binding protein|nr:PstS family phosphate ABC transporter substrate-binding protein [Trueperaceae bacterium]
MQMPLKPLRPFLTLVAITFGLSAAAQGTIVVDGSSTVYPISLAMAEEFTIDNPSIPVSVGFSGTGGGLSKICAGEIDIADASRVVKPSELEACAANGIELIELPVAADALTVVVNKQNDFASCLTVAELHAIWAPDSQVTSWSQVRADFPDAPITLFGPGTDSGTFEYFTEAVNGKAGAIRTDFFPSEDDNVLVRGVESDTYAMGYFGFAYYAADAERLNAVSVDGGNGCVAPSAATIEDGTYSPLSRPLFIYVSLKSLETKPGLAEFVEYYLSQDARELVEHTGYATYSDEIYDAVAARFSARTTGTAFAGFEPGDSVLDAVKGIE